MRACLVSSEPELGPELEPSWELVMGMTVAGLCFVAKSNPGRYPHFDQEPKEPIRTCCCCGRGTGTGTGTGQLATGNGSVSINEACSGGCSRIMAVPDSVRRHAESRLIGGTVYAGGKEAPLS